MASNYNVDDDEDVIFCDQPSDTVELYSDESSMSEDSARAPKRSFANSQPEVIEIFDSDEEMEPEVVKKSPRLMVLNPDKAREVQKMIDKILEEYGKDSKVDHSGSTAATASIQSLQHMLEISTRSSKDFSAVRTVVVESGVIATLFECLSKFTHHFQTIEAAPEHPQPSTSRAIPKIKLAIGRKGRWTKAKDNGTGYGYGAGLGASKSTFNSTQAKLKNENVHVTALLQFFASYINPQDDIPSVNESVIELPKFFIELLEQSCLDPVLRSYLRNDSILDMAQHVPLYRAFMLLIRAIATSNQIVHLLMMKQDESDETITDLIWKIKRNADAYSSRVNGLADDDAELNFLIEDIQHSTFLLESATHLFLEGKTVVNKPAQSVEEKYLEVMKALQFESYDIVTESENSDYCFTVAYHYEANTRKNGTHGSAARIKRLAQEYATLSNSLPLSFSSSVFVRADSNRLDIMKFLITGPAGTPYENGCFIFDVYFPPEYPNEPPKVNLETTGRHAVRFNPNLYNCGKVCLSLLNTWTGKPEEKWSKASSFLQVLVSIQSLILVDDPYFNEPGCQSMRGTPRGTTQSNVYNHDLYPKTVNWAMLDHMRNPVACFKDVIQKHFWLKRNEIIQQVDRWIDEVKSTSCFAQNLKAYKSQLAAEFLKLPTPDGMENFSIDTGEINKAMLEKLAKEQHEMPLPIAPQRLRPNTDLLKSWSDMILYPLNLTAGSTVSGQQAMTNPPSVGSSIYNHPAPFSPFSTYLDYAAPIPMNNYPAQTAGSLPTIPNTFINNYMTSSHLNSHQYLQGLAQPAVTSAVPVNGPSTTSSLYSIGLTPYANHNFSASPWTTIGAAALQASANNLQATTNSLQESANALQALANARNSSTNPQNSTVNGATYRSTRSRDPSSKK